MMNPHSMFYNIIGEEILFTALIYLRSSWAGKNTKQLVKYSSVLYFKPTKLCMYTYDMIWYIYGETRNLIEIPGRGVKIFKLPLDHEPSYEDLTYYGKLLCSTWSIAVLIYLARLSISNVYFLTDAIMRTISVDTVCIRIKNLTIIVAFINTYDYNRFAKGNWIEKKICWSVCWITRQLLLMNGYSTFF